jgi:multidrug resistance efflux pump
VPSWVSTDFVLQPGERVTMRAPVAGVISEVRVREGQSVDAGAVLAVLRNPDIETRAAVGEKSLELVNRSLMAAEARRDTSEINRYSLERQRLQHESAAAATERAGLIVKAPFAGVVTTPRVEERAGEYLPVGAEFAALANRQEMRARILVRDVELEDVVPGARVELNLRAHPFRTFCGSVGYIMPAAALDRPIAELNVPERSGQVLANYFAVVLEFPNPEGLLREGMTGTTKIYRQHRSPLAWQAARSGWRWAYRQLW